MAKVKIGSMKHKALIEGDVNLLEKNEILVAHSDGYTILRERLESGVIKTYVVVPLEDFQKKEEKTEEVNYLKVDCYGKESKEAQTYEP